MWWLYTLSYNGNTFYVGITRNLVNRYKYHCNFTYETTHNYIHWIKEAGELPSVTLIAYYHKQDIAAGAEMALIRHFISIGNKLCNNDLNPLHNRIITCNPYPLSYKKKRLKNGYATAIIASAYKLFEKQFKLYKWIAKPNG